MRSAQAVAASLQVAADAARGTRSDRVNASTSPSAVAIASSTRMGVLAGQTRDSGGDVDNGAEYVTTAVEHRTERQPGVHPPQGFLTGDESPTTAAWPPRLTRDRRSRTALHRRGS